MANAATTAATPAADEAPPVRRRLTAEARKRSILQAAREAFTETGDANGTTIRVIAERGGISEGVIYRHFESKDQLFFEAVVEPLREAVDSLVAATEVVDRDGPITPQRRQAAMKSLYRQLTSTLDEMLPLLGLVLFGDPETAHRFYRESFAVAMDRLGDAWQAAAERFGAPMDAPDLSARAVMGMALITALERHHNEHFDADRALDALSERTINGFFPDVPAAATTKGNGRR